MVLARTGAAGKRPAMNANRKLMGTLLPTDRNLNPDALGVISLYRPPETQYKQNSTLLRKKQAAAKWNSKMH
jgi:hypothetical protein